MMRLFVVAMGKIENYKLLRPTHFSKKIEPV